ncbi:voltage-gated potassium channel [Basidiobolus meristosporus CBS 931.73]|uniref:Voltage-gated potassium channel n=1 Tax=Basidiobolus meristosporus CBS 931.73 TaxID=1314790 RepID=A0A1Y1YJY6_9FUNG|nr:voltage-gated potassium channel [Basidiobolus meristosporus CBS 931.73]|eukprot:ORX98325.1 voltage-gated potassium channel [Basidiobolus meristosporus CBS 931.73]
MSTLPQRSQEMVDSFPNSNPTKIILDTGECSYHDSPTLISTPGLDTDHVDCMSSFDSSAVEDNLTDNSLSSDEEKSHIENAMSPFRAWCYRFFVISENWQARLFYLVSHILLLLMVISFCLETIPSVYQTESNEWIIFSKTLDIALLVILSLEFVGKLYGWPKRWRFFLNYKNILDLLTIIPFVIVTFFESVASSYFFRVLRLLKVFTLLKIFRVNQYSPGIYVTTHAIKRSVIQILVVSLYLIVAILISSSLVFFVEQSEYDKANRVWVREVNGQLEPSPFQSIVHAFYWSVVTLTTTGYGDVVPVTNLGKMIAGFTMICGVLVIALPTSIIGSNLVSEWENYNRLKFQAEFKQLKRQTSLRSLREKRIKDKALRHQNRQMMNLISEIQERLYDVNPPHYYLKYKRLANKYLDMKHKVALLRGGSGEIQKKCASD